MLVGILCEGGLDIEPLKILFTKTFLHCTPQPPLNEPSFKRPFIAEGQIITKLDAGAELLLKDPAPDVIVLYSDVDKYPDRRKSLREWVTKNEHLCNFVPLIIEPHFEEIFFAEHNSMVRELGLSHTEPLPYADMPPKKRLEAIIKDKRESGFIDFTVNRQEIYSNIVSGLNLDNLLRQSSDYRSFREQIARIDVQ